MLEEWIVEGVFDEESEYTGTTDLRAREGDPPDAIFVVTFPVGLGVLDALRKEHPALEDQIQIAIFGNQQLNRYLRPPFLCVAQPARSLGERATELLLGQMQRRRDGGERGPEQVVLATHVADDRASADSSASE